VKHQIVLEVNGQVHRISTEPYRTLLEVLRDDLSLTGTKYSCGEGECGACTVLLDDKPIMSCLALAVAVDGSRIQTIEGVADGGMISPLQRNFLAKGAVQCGYCTPGVVMSAKALLDENPNPTEQEVREYMEGNLCRCTGYAKIVDAILATARTTRALQP
jgi:aerobic carbon-monoxide dehydrogenase small subunit